MEPVTPEQLRKAAEIDQWTVVDAPDGHKVIIQDPRVDLLRAAADRIEELERLIRELQDVYDEGLSDDLA